MNDARGALQLTSARFDAIVSQPSHPWTAGASHLYTREFFALVREHLAPGGVFVQWIGLGFVDAPLLRTLVATLLDVFPAVRVYQPMPGAVLFLASDADLPMEARAAQALAAAPADFARYGLRLPEDVAAACVLGDDGARRFAAGAPLNTDDHNLLAARSARLGARALFAKGLRRVLAGLSRRSPRPMPRSIPSTWCGAWRRPPGPSAPRRSRARCGDPVARETAQGFVQRARGERLGAARSFERALALDAQAAEARFGLLEARRAARRAGRPGAARARAGAPARGGGGRRGLARRGARRRCGAAPARRGAREGRAARSGVRAGDAAAGLVADPQRRSGSSPRRRSRSSTA